MFAKNYTLFKSKIKFILNKFNIVISDDHCLSLYEKIMANDKNSNNEFVKFIKAELELLGYSIKLQGTYEVLSQLTCNHPWNICKVKNIVFSDFFKVIDRYVFSGNDLFDIKLAGLSRKNIYGIKSNDDLLLNKFFVALSCDVLINSSNNVLFIEYGPEYSVGLTSFRGNLKNMDINTTDYFIDEDTYSSVIKKLDFMPTNSGKLNKNQIIAGLLNAESRKEIPDLIILANFYKIFNENLEIAADVMACLNEYSIKNNCCIIAGLNDKINLKNEIGIQSRVIKNDCTFDVTFKNKKYDIKMDVNKNKFLK